MKLDVTMEACRHRMTGADTMSRIISQFNSKSFRNAMQNTQTHYFTVDCVHSLASR